MERASTTGQISKHTITVQITIFIPRTIPGFLVLLLFYSVVVAVCLTCASLTCVVFSLPGRRKIIFYFSDASVIRLNMFTCHVYEYDCQQG
jgi:hypothetical protein